MDTELGEEWVDRRCVHERGWGGGGTEGPVAKKEERYKRLIKKIAVSVVQLMHVSWMTGEYVRTFRTHREGEGVMRPGDGDGTVRGKWRERVEGEMGNTSVVCSQAAARSSASVVTAAQRAASLLPRTGPITILWSRLAALIRAPAFLGNVSVPSGTFPFPS